MQRYQQLWKSIFGKAAVAAVALGGFLLFPGTPGAEARPVVRYYHAPVVRYHAVPVRPRVVVNGYYGPNAAYWRLHRHEVFVHGWRDRFGYWHRY